MDLSNAVWRKARRSSENGGECVEVAAVFLSGDAIWRKSSHSGENGGNCVEVAASPSHIAVRDSKSPQGPALVFPREIWQHFTTQVKTGSA
ncbi:MAG: hypothetical protein JWN52_2753 [Actinomycetia bacterium]|nr:hypothetical protein [Actinomycetes bacterium]